MVALVSPVLWMLALAPLKAGDLAPTSLDVVTLDGRRLALELRGQITLVEMFATWCPRCRESVTGYQRIAAQYGDRVRVVIVDHEEPAATVMRFFPAASVPPGLLVTRDPGGRAMRAFGTSTLPHSCIIDAEGVIRAVGTGWSSSQGEWLTRWLDRLLKKPDRKAAAKQRPAPARSNAADDHARELGVEVLR